MSPVGKVLLAFFLAVATTVALRFALGARRDQWFRRDRPKSFVTLRSQVSMHLALGYPVTKEGFIVAILLVCVIVAEVAAVVCLL